MNRTSLVPLRRVTALVPLLLVVACGAPVDVGELDQPVVWNGSELVEINSAPANLKALGDAVAELVPPGQLLYDPTINSLIWTSATSQYNLCPEVQFASQPSLKLLPAQCSAVLVSDGLFATNAHCLNAGLGVGSKLVFGYRMTDATNAQTFIHDSEIYTVHSIYALGNYANDISSDWALLSVDRPVTGHTPVVLEPVVPLANVVIQSVGYPLGWPEKAALNGITTASNPYGPGMFGAHITEFLGDSGSPVFNATTNHMLGLIARGNSDFTLDTTRGCNLFTRCFTEPDCWGEGVVRADQFASLVHREPMGYFENAAAGFVTGWALDANWPNGSAWARVTIDGVELSYGWQIFAEPRPDVNQVTGYPGNHGFKLPVSAQYRDGNAHTVRVYARDAGQQVVIELPGSPRTYRESLPIGTVDSANDGVVAGWTFDRDLSGLSLNIAVSCESTYITAVANTPRPDVNAAYGISGNHGFSVPLPASLRDGRQHTVTVFAWDSNGDPNSSKAIGSKPFVWSTPPMGALERVDAAGNAIGWALDPDSIGASIRVQLYLDGDLGVGTALPIATASVARPDVNTATGYPGNYGFSVALPAATHDGHTHSLYAYALDAQDGHPVRLPGTPATFALCPPCANGFVCNPTTATCGCPSGTSWCSTLNACAACCPICDGEWCGEDGCGGTCQCPSGFLCGSVQTCVRVCPTGQRDCGDGVCVPLRNGCP
jgi:Trypsin-like peptidase domain